MTTTFIPRDIIVEILSWLPAKSVLRLRWACKYWFDLITRDSSCNKLHFQRRLTSTIPHPASVLILSSNSKCVGHGANELTQCYLNRSCVSSPQVSISYPFQSPAGIEVLGSCNGLLLCKVCTSDDDAQVFIWNPCSQEYKVLPNPSPLTNCMVGFGYDSTLDDYNVITRSTYAPYNLQIYTLGTNSWRKIERNPHLYSYLSSSTWKFANGCFYWIDSLDEKIMSFDIGKEKYQEVSIKQFNGLKVLHVFEGSLCLVQVFRFSLQMWVMEDKGTANESSRTSWAQLFTTPVSLVHCPYPIDRLIRFGKNGVILLFKMYDKDELVLYDPKTNTTMDFNVICRGKKYPTEVYIESLVSLNSGTYVEQGKQRKRRNSGTYVE